jgi:hypothetical protein
MPSERAVACEAKDGGGLAPEHCEVCGETENAEGEVLQGLDKFIFPTQMAPL